MHLCMIFSSFLQVLAYIAIFYALNIHIIISVLYLLSHCLAEILTKNFNFKIAVYLTVLYLMYYYMIKSADNDYRAFINYDPRPQI